MRLGFIGLGNMGGRVARRLLAAGYPLGVYARHPESTRALVDLGANTTDISIFRNGLIGFTRSTPLAGNALSRAISEQVGQPLDQAERLKKDLGRVPEGGMRRGRAG